MKSYLEQEALGRLRHEELLAQAAWERQFGHLRHQRTWKLSALFRPITEQVRRWFAPRQSGTNERIASASRQQAC